MLGSILFGKGEIDEANHAWFASFTYGKPTAQVLFAQAKVLLKAGQQEAGLDAIAKGIELWPGDLEVYSTLSALAPRNPKAARLLASIKEFGPLLKQEQD
jgi:hypothetical protein